MKIIEIRVKIADFEFILASQVVRIPTYDHVFLLPSVLKTENEQQFLCINKYIFMKKIQQQMLSRTTF